MPPSDSNNVQAFHKTCFLQNQSIVSNNSMVSFRDVLGLVIGICIFLILIVEPTISSTACILNLYALAQRANQTGQIYLDPTEQRNCLIKLDGRSCGSCVKSWDDIKEQKPYEYAQPDICRFAVLVSLTSTATDDLAWILNIRDSSIKFADPKLEGEYSAEAFDRAFKLALSCTGLKQQRPSIQQVVAKLEELHDISMSGRASTPRTTPTWSDIP